MNDKEIKISFNHPVISITKPSEASNGDMYYDTTKGIICAYISGEWKEITNKHEPRWPDQLKETLKKL